MEEIYDRIKSVIEAVDHKYEFGIGDVTPSTQIKNYLDSLDIAELVIELEKEFNVAIKDEEILQWETPSDILRSVENALTESK